MRERLKRWLLRSSFHLNCYRVFYACLIGGLAFLATLILVGQIETTGGYRILLGALLIAAPTGLIWAFLKGVNRLESWADHQLEPSFRDADRKERMRRAKIQDGGEGTYESAYFSRNDDPKEYPRAKLEHLSEDDPDFDRKFQERWDERNNK